jgi:hypothetical protein
MPLLRKGFGELKYLTKVVVYGIISMSSRRGISMNKSITTFLFITSLFKITTIKGAGASPEWISDLAQVQDLWSKQPERPGVVARRLYFVNTKKAFDPSGELIELNNLNEGTRVTQADVEMMPADDHE